ncbi:hypothetical protein [Lentzea flaviverrucosa]|uniref:Lipoprotein n=1 Tax=Lentzea flaviverrucosa TaxID=200379 RepID=A0A1H9LYJ7_9PSEU|nr:hypothetical protein [Lentzea flaviverrucosa]RDI31139.1 hypothetical protein DFR72_104476 [Lentzea flaviverrucosa]SER16511.1 hypothetical protein SAMN05216195_104150 [Lentzea flaviverrucosa]
MRLAATAIIAALALTACSSSEPASDTKSQHRDVQSLVAAVTKTAGEKGSYRFSITPPPTGGGVRAPASGSVRLGGEVPSMDATTQRPVQTGGEAVDLRLVSTRKDIAFVKLPAAVFGLPADKPWVELDRKVDDDFTTTLLGFHDVVYQQAAFTTYHLPVIQAGGELRLTAQVGGNTRYSIAVDYKKAYDNLTDEGLKAEVKLALDQKVAGSTGEVELDGSGLPIRITFYTEFQGAQIVDEARFSDWGSDVEIAEPNPAEISSRK